nr:hypothetical protein [Tanacetum cinerariifolium]
MIPQNQCLLPANADEFNQEDSVDFDANMVFVPYDAPNFKEAELSTTALDLSNMHEFHQEEGIDFAESFAPVAHLEAIRIRPSTRSCLLRSLMVPKFRYDSLLCHNHDFVEVALDMRQTGEEVAILEIEIVYKLDSRAPFKSKILRIPYDNVIGLSEVPKDSLDLFKVFDRWTECRNDEVVNYVLNNQEVPSTRLDPGSYKESLEVEKTIVVSQHVKVIEEEGESAEDDYALRRREKGKNVEESRHTPSPTIIRSPRIHSTLTRFLARKKFNVLAQHFQEVMEEALPNMVGESSAKRKMTSEHRTYVFRESLSGQVNESKPGSLTSGNQEQLDDFDFFMDTYATDDDELPVKKVSQKLVEEMLETVDEAKLRKERVHNFHLGVKRYQQKVYLTTPTITFLGIEKYKMFSIVSKPVYDIIYKNIKKEKRVMRHQEVHKFRDAKLKRFLEGLKSYNNNVKNEYVTPSLSKEDVKNLQLFEEDINELLKHRD